MNMENNDDSQIRDLSNKKEIQQFVDLKLETYIKQLNKFVSLYGFIEGAIESKDLVFYFIFVKTYEINLITYSIIQSILLFPRFIKIFLGMISDNLPIFGSRRKNYMIMLSLIEIILYPTCFFCIYFKKHYFIIFILNFFLKLTNSWRAVINISLMISLKELNILKDKKVSLDSSNKSTSNYFLAKFTGKLVIFTLISFLYDQFSYKFLFLYTTIALISFILSLYLLEPPFNNMSYKEFKAKITFSIEIIKKNKLYILLLILIFTRAAPSLVETSEYYFTIKLYFTSFMFSIKNILLTVSIVLSIALIKFKIFNYYTKYSLSTILSILIFSSFLLFFILTDYFQIENKVKIVLVYIKGMVYYLGLESIIIVLFNIYITFCPKDIEGTFSTFFFSISEFSHEIGTVLEDFILYIFDISSETNYDNIFWLIFFNILVLSIGFFWIYKLIIPTTFNLNQEGSVMSIESERKFFNDETMDLDEIISRQSEQAHRFKYVQLTKNRDKKKASDRFVNND